MSYTTTHPIKAGITVFTDLFKIFLPKFPTLTVISYTYDCGGSLLDTPYLLKGNRLLPQIITYRINIDIPLDWIS